MRQSQNIRLTIDYAVERTYQRKNFQVLTASVLGEQRPVDDEARLIKMLENGSLIVTARSNSKLI